MLTYTSLAQPEQEIAAVRAFNRFYTRKLEVLDQHLLKTPFSLSEARVMFELAHRGDLSAKEIGLELGLDPGYLSRIVQKFDEDGLISRKPLASDRRQYQLSLTAKGRAAFAKLEHTSQDHVGLMLGALAGEDRKRLLGAMEVIERLLGAARTPLLPAILRDPRPGDMGYVVQSHGALYASEYGFDAGFEALVAEIAAHFLRNFDSKRERCWIAERDGENLGCVCLVRESDKVAKLRVLLVEPQARGLGLGHRLVAECIRFAKQAGYRKIILWTSEALIAARRVYEKAGFQLVEEKRHNMFGPDWVGQTWELVL